MLICLLSFAPTTACTSDRQGDSEAASKKAEKIQRYNQARLDFADSIAEPVRSWAQNVVLKFIRDPPASNTPLSQVGELEVTTTLSATLCAQLQAFQRAIDGLPDPNLRQTQTIDAKIFIEGTAFDGVVRALLGLALTYPPAERDQVLDGLGISATGDSNNAKLSGLEALKKLGLLDAQGAVSVPAMRFPNEANPERKKYRDDLGTYSPGFPARVGGYVTPLRGRVNQCFPQGG